MIPIYTYDSDTRSFAIKGSMISKLGNKALNTVGGSKAGKLTIGLNLGIAALGVASAAKGAHSAFKDGSKFSVVFKTESGPMSKTVTAKSPVEAITKVGKLNKGTGFRAFRMPDQDDKSQDYFNSLK